MKNRSLLLSVLAISTLLLSACGDPDVQQYIDASEVLRWEETIAVFDSLNQVEASDENTLLVTGSSSVRLWKDIHEDLAPFSVMKRGYGGARLNDFNHYAERIIKPGSFKGIVIFVANDICCESGNRTPREVLALFKTLVSTIRERNPETPVFWVEVTPTGSRWWLKDEIFEANRLIKRYCEREEDLHFIATWDAYLDEAGVPDSTLFRSDELHQNRAGYELWSRLIKEQLAGYGIAP